MEHAQEIGLVVGPVRVDMAALQKWKAGVVEKLTGGISQLLKANNVEVVKGEARFTGPNELQVTGASTETIQADAFIVATGSRPIEIPGFKFDGKRVLTSTEALELREIPQSLVVIGGGAIGLEMGTLYHSLGAKVTVVELMDQIVPGMDTELATTYGRLLKRRGIEVHLKAAAKEFDGKNVKVQTADGETLNIPASHVLVTVGRRANTDRLGLDKAGVQADKRGIISVDHQMRTNVSHIYAIGDVAPGPMLAHKASKEAVVAAESIAGHKAANDFQTIPAVVYTDPEIASCGLTEAQAKEKGHETRTGKFPFAASGRALTTNDADGFVKIVIDRPTGVVLGVHIIGANASDLISEAALAIEMGATAEDLSLTVHPHPTLPEALMEAAEAALGKAIHQVNK